MAPGHYFTKHLIAVLLFLSFSGLLHGQQPYTGQTITNCPVASLSTSVRGYLCGAQSTTAATAGPLSCDTYLTFHPRPPYETPQSISAVLAANASDISRANSLPLDSASSPFPSSTTKILVPVRCTCSDPGFYQTNTSYTIRTDDTLLTIAQSTFQGLSTCQALADQNRIANIDQIFAGDALTVPLRCACPSAPQAAEGVRYLLSYLVDSGDDVQSVSQRFGVDTNSTLVANGLTFRRSTVVPLTTLLVPLKTEPTSSQLASTPQLSPPPPPTFLAPPSRSKNRTALYVGISVGAACILVLLASGILVYYHRRHRGNAATKRSKHETPVSSADNAPKLFGASTADKPSEASLSKDNFFSEISDLWSSFKQYKFKELQQATDNFSPSSLIGDSVYRGDFNGDAAAIKIMDRDALKEIEILMKFNHSNLIGLSGVCLHEGRWYLVYEYAENGSLSDWLFDSTGSKALSWVQRVQIALDVANGLNYLHNFTDPCYVHKDVRPTNILLDANFKAKIVNFGLARSLESEADQPVLTRHIVGTHGYMAPEYLEHGLVTPNLDVYAFGVVMMEMITGKAVATQLGQDGAFSANVMVGLFGQEGDAGEDLIKDQVDPLLQGNYAPIPASIMAKLAAQCLRRDKGSRPTMVEIVQCLSGVSAASVASRLP